MTEGGNAESQRITKRRYRASLSMLSVRIAQPTKDQLAELVPDGQRSEFVDLALRAALTKLGAEQGTPSMSTGERVRRIASTLGRLSDELRELSTRDD
jgi:hypothetical protein